MQFNKIGSRDLQNKAYFQKPSGESGMKHHSGTVRIISALFAWCHWIWDTWAGVLSNNTWGRDTACRLLWRLFNQLYCKLWHAGSFEKGSDNLMSNSKSYFCHRQGQIGFLLRYEIIAKSLKSANIILRWMEGFQVYSKILQVCELIKEEKAQVLSLNAY